MAKLLTNSPEYENLITEWHSTKNPNLDINALTAGSGRTVWWQCQRNVEHEWQMAILTRTQQKQGCPYCSGRRVDSGRNDLASQYPLIAAEWDHNKNNSNPLFKDLTLENIAAGSNKKASWIGSDCGHKWDAIIQSRTRGGNTCPYCANRKTLAGFNDLGSSLKHAYLVEEWDPTNELQPTEVMVSSNKKVAWICSIDSTHRWEAIINNRTSRGSGCPHCYRNNVQNGVVASKAPLSENAVLAEEYSHTLNDEGIADLTLGSGKVVWWECKEDRRHIWQSRIVNRDRGAGCPACAGQFLIPGVNDLASHPDREYLVNEWHEDNVLAPSEVLASSSVQYKWKCEKGHEWESSIYARVRQSQNCPQCAGRTGDTKQFVSEFADLMIEWHPDNEVDPTQVASRGAQRIKWQCQANSKHEWIATPFQRTIRKSGCPVCAGMKVIAGINDVASHPKFQHLVTEWHEDNTLLPTELSYSSNKLILWKCSANEKHSTWATSLSTRTHRTRPTGCPDCAAARRVSLGEQQIADWLVSLDINITQSARGIIPNRELDIFLPEHMVAIEFNGLYWHSSKIRSNPSYHYDKWKACNDLGITLYQVWEDDWYNRRDAVVNDLKTLLRGSEMDLEYTALDEAPALAFLNEFNVNPDITGQEFWGLTDTSEKIQGAYVVTDGVASHLTARGNRETMKRLVSEVDVRTVSVDLFNESVVARELEGQGFVVAETRLPRAFLVDNLTRTLRVDENDEDNIIWDAGSNVYKLETR